jgi:hypothetical protein
MIRQRAAEFSLVMYRRSADANPLPAYRMRTNLLAKRTMLAASSSAVPEGIRIPADLRVLERPFL